jgi:hypothetical protein
LCEGIQNLAAHFDAPHKFHRTLTQALLHIMRARGGAGHRLTWNDFLGANNDLLDDARGVIACHYSGEVLASEAARNHLVAPGIAPMPPLRQHANSA